MPGPADTTAFLAAEPPRLPVSELAIVVEDQFALSGEYTPLVSERDQNFRLSASDGNRYVVKVSNAREAAMVTGVQVDLLQHLAQFDAPPTPVVIQTKTGNFSTVVEYQGQPCAVRIVSYLDGRPLASVPVTIGLAHDLGVRLAGLHEALRSFAPAFDSPFSYWDLQRAATIDDLRHHIDDPAVATLVARALAEFGTGVEPRLDELQRQAIHGDANPENVLVDARGVRVSGFIDFGDTVFAPRIVDIAIAASYLRTTNANPLHLVQPFVAAYQSVAALEPIEIRLLPSLVRARLATTISMLYWRLSATHEDDPYRQKTLQSERGAIDFLRAARNSGVQSGVNRSGLDELPRQTPCPFDG